MFRTVAWPFTSRPGCRCIRSMSQRGTSTSNGCGQVAPLRVAQVAVALALELQHALDLLGRLGLRLPARAAALRRGRAVRAARSRPGLRRPGRASCGAAVRCGGGPPPPRRPRRRRRRRPPWPGAPGWPLRPWASGRRRRGGRRLGRGGLRGPAHHPGSGSARSRSCCVCSGRGDGCAPPAVPASRLERRRSRHRRMSVARGPPAPLPRRWRAARSSRGVTSSSARSRSTRGRSPRRSKPTSLAGGETTDCIAKKIQERKGRFGPGGGRRARALATATDPLAVKAPGASSTGSASTGPSSESARGRAARAAPRRRARAGTGAPPASSASCPARAMLPAPLPERRTRTDRPDSSRARSRASARASARDRGDRRGGARGPVARSRRGPPATASTSARGSFRPSATRARKSPVERVDLPLEHAALRGAPGLRHGGELRVLAARERLAVDRAASPSSPERSGFAAKTPMEPVSVDGLGDDRLGADGDEVAAARRDVPERRHHQLALPPRAAPPRARRGRTRARRRRASRSGARSPSLAGPPRRAADPPDERVGAGDAVAPERVGRLRPAR